MNMFKQIFLCCSVLVVPLCHSMQREQMRVMPQANFYFLTELNKRKHEGKANFCFDNLKIQQAQEYLLKNITTQGYQWAPIHLAVRYPTPGPLKFFLNQKLSSEQINSQHNILRQTPLHIAVREGSLAYVKLLLRHGASLKRRDINQKTPLDLAQDLELFEILKFLKQVKAAREKQAEPENAFCFLDFLQFCPQFDLSLLDSLNFYREYS